MSESAMSLRHLPRPTPKKRKKHLPMSNCSPTMRDSTTMVRSWEMMSVCWTYAASGSPRWRAPLSAVPPY